MTCFNRINHRLKERKPHRLFLNLRVLRSRMLAGQMVMTLSCGAPQATAYMFSDVSWHTKRQTLTAASIFRFQAELIAAATCSDEAKCFVC
mmetsp:Transcript_31428/g.97237  ORF Transcript_31428/g.97237 Transcript_31428/m.97237 type:complete len:91 (-) Transcript_31428:628-900(-)